MLWQSGASESATVNMFCLLFKIFAIDCVCVRGTGSHHLGVYSLSEIIHSTSAVLTAACVLQIHTSIITVCHTTLFPFRVRTDITNSLYLLWKLKLAIMVRGVILPTCTCSVWPIVIHWVSWPIRADCAFQKEGLCRKWCVWERWTYDNVHYFKNCFFNIKACQHVLLHQIHKIMIFKIASYDP